ncbi:hypothetical protein AAF712_013936 [Marasmius tenuissimus]|uniref:Uncharacterized protein n=1 Tax=Marasmius tenuissimus TaxID=585030 RepID=A0ABR2ZDJ3_9AGAR
MAPTVQVLHQADSYIDIHLSTGPQNHANSLCQAPIPVVLLDVPKECFLGPMIIRVCTAQASDLSIDANSNESGDTTLVHPDSLQPSRTASPSSVKSTKSERLAPTSPVNHDPDTIFSQDSQSLKTCDFTISGEDTDDSQWSFSTQAANFIDMCEGREDRIVERAATAIDVVSGKCLRVLFELHEIEQALRFDHSGDAICEVSPRTILASTHRDLRSSNKFSDLPIDTSPIAKAGKATLAEISRLLPPHTPIRQHVPVESINDSMHESNSADNGSSTDSEFDEGIERIWDDLPPSQSSEIPVVCSLPEKLHGDC